ncbi:MAG: thiamine/thiamine pyrophosphate ABC transporter, permease protein [Gammaproteobacteria bacterium]|nr:thiamine/thiamine pyrophosphate ABC transporter, permease protein [Gammaproteobacteria bacterium]
MQRTARSAYPVLLFLAMLILVPLTALVGHGLASDDELNLTALWHSQYLAGVVSFSIWQATLSTVLSVGLAVAVARAFARFGLFPFRNLILRLFGLPLVVPAVVAVLGIVSVYGSGGWIPLGRDLYGLNGILLAHLFFNLPLAIRLLLPSWYSIPTSYWHMSQQLQMNQWQQWRHLEWPVLRESLPGVCLLIFMLCLTSFAVVLTLGGGPKSTTLEVAIYQSLRFDFDPLQAVVLALLQLLLCATVAAIAFFMQKMPEVNITLSAQSSDTTSNKTPMNALLILATVIFVTMPLLAMLLDAISGSIFSVLSSTALWRAAAISICIGLTAAFLSVSMAWLILRTSADLAYGGKKRSASGVELSGQIIYVVPPLVLGTGFFILISPHFNVFNWAIPIVIVINALMGLPFALRSLGASMRQNKMRYHRLCQSLNISGWHRLRLIEWPLLRRPTGLAAALVAALAMGDLGVIALFGTPQTTTLPLMLYHQLGAYLVEEAAVTAVFLLLCCLLIFWLLELLIGGKRHA